jgi:hypothetical protein
MVRTAGQDPAVLIREFIEDSTLLREFTGGTLHVRTGK